MKINSFLSKKSKRRKFRQTHTLPPSISIGLLLMVFFFTTACNRSKKPNQPLSKSYLLSHLNTKEKLELLGGVVMSTKPIPRLGIPSLRMNDGPVGVRWGHASAFPAGVSFLRLPGASYRNILLSGNVKWRKGNFK